MTILVTGSEGFIARNLILKLKENKFQVQEFHRGSEFSEIEHNLDNISFIFHLAGENRPENDDAFYETNQLLTEKIVNCLKSNNRNIPIVFSSSTQIEENNHYGKSKLRAEEAIKTLGRAVIYRLPGVFGKWSKPNYNSVVSTFAYNCVNGIELVVNDDSKVIKLIYIDEVVNLFLQDLNEQPSGVIYPVLNNFYEITLGDLASKMLQFKRDHKENKVSNVGSGLDRALYSTFLSFLEPEQFLFPVKAHIDDRGQFSEILKTSSSGQFSFFTAKPGVTRGEHYHHSKNEKFLVVKGSARFRFRNVITNHYCELEVDSKDLNLVCTIPGWAHDITNIGKEEMIVFLWANEIFDPNQPDTIFMRLENEIT